MRYSILLILLLLNFSFVSREEEKKFNQDVATIHSQKPGLPEGNILSIGFHKDEVVASAEKSSYKRRKIGAGRHILFASILYGIVS